MFPLPKKNPGVVLSTRPLCSGVCRCQQVHAARGVSHDESKEADADRITGDPEVDCILRAIGEYEGQKFKDEKDVQTFVEIFKRNPDLVQHLLSKDGLEIKKTSVSHDETKETGLCPLYTDGPYIFDEDGPYMFTDEGTFVTYWWRDQQWGFDFSKERFYIQRDNGRFSLMYDFCRKKSYYKQKACRFGHECRQKRRCTFLHCDDCPYDDGQEHYQFCKLGRDLGKSRYLKENVIRPDFYGLRLHLRKILTQR